MSVGSSNRTGIAFIEETVEGAIPTPTAVFSDLRFTGESLSLTLANTESKEISDSRQTTDLVQTGAECGGGINFELSGGTYDKFFEAALGSTFSTAINISATGIAFAPNAAGDTITGSGFPTIVANQWILVSGCLLAGLPNNGLHQVASANGTVITLKSKSVIAAYTATAVTVTIVGKMLRNPTTGLGLLKKSFCIERRHGDINKFFIFKGMRVNTVSLKCATGAIVDGSMDFLGRSSASGEVTYSTSAINAATTTKVLNAISDVETANILIDGVSMGSAYIQSLDFAISNNLRGIKAIGIKGNADIAEGKLGVTGNLNVYFNDTVFYTKYINSSEFSISYSILNKETGRGYVISIPRAMISTDKVNAASEGQDLVENMAWMGLKCIAGYTIQIDAF